MQATMHAPWTIRTARIGDSSEMARLLTMLGFPASMRDVESRWPAWEAEGNAALVLADETSTLGGLLTMHSMTVLHRPHPVGRITSLVIDERLRGNGLGSALVAQAEQLMRRNGCGLIEVTSNMRLPDAHRFYERLGFERVSYRFAKS